MNWKDTNFIVSVLGNFFKVYLIKRVTSKIKGEYINLTTQYGRFLLYRYAYKYAHRNSHAAPESG